ncbi:hypothetical protein K7X08_025882 [Anisodus acutangulus]|uniref:Uncharacterized protein n=1 Tax=Anisodus acutangulus TaxID=402998 RepID=A0A9Q1N1G1_9SOLA|nr:hypothetical protein K7X08_025882 [Anisodus acutangulus]
MPSFLPHRVSPPNKLVVLNQTCLDLPTTSSEGRKWGDEEEEEVADNVESSSGLQKGKAPMESQIADDMTESTEDKNNVPLNKEYAEIPSNISPEKIKWSDEVEEVVDEGEILNSEESTNSISPDDPGEEEEGKENQMDINTVSEEVDTQDAPPLKDNSIVAAEPTSIEAEIGAGISQQPEVNLNPGKGQPTAPPVLPTVREEEISSKQKSVSKSKKQGNNDQAIS